MSTDTIDAIEREVTTAATVTATTITAIINEPPNPRSDPDGAGKKILEQYLPDFFEDKLVQSAVNKILCAIFEPMFLPCSYGFRPARDCHTALRALQQHTYQNQDGAVVEIDIRKYFNSVQHNWMLECLSSCLILVEVSDRIRVFTNKHFYK